MFNWINDLGLKNSLFFPFLNVRNFPLDFNTPIIPLKSTACKNYAGDMDFKSLIDQQLSKYRLLLC